MKPIPNSSIANEQRSDEMPRDAGISLIEIVLSLVLLSAVVAAYGASLTTGMRQRAESTAQYEALSRIRTVCASIQDIANQEQDVESGVGIGALFALYDGKTLTSEDLGGMVLPNEEVTFEVYGNETTVPDEFGGPRDLNFDGDADDDSATKSGGIDLRLVPMRIELSYDIHGKTYFVERFRLFTKTTN